MYYWYEHERGFDHVAVYLATLDLTGFNPKAPPPKTTGFHAMIDAGRAPEDSQLADLIDSLTLDGKPPAAITITDLTTKCRDDCFLYWLQDRRNARMFSHRLEAVGYVAVVNDADKHSGRWKVGNKRLTIYARRELTVRDRLAAATALCRHKMD